MHFIFFKLKSDMSFFSHMLSFFNKQNSIIVVLLISCYVLVMLSVITWGIPNKDHPFNYHMDEWHQLQAVRATFKHGTPNIEGAAHGSMLQFVLSGIYLIPFTILGIVDPFSIKSALTQLDIQEKLFIILRTNTIMFGVLCLLLINKTTKQYFKVPSFISVILLFLTPVWISLSNFFKYDIALTFWITASIFSLLRFGTNTTRKNYVFASIVCSLALATKLSAIPLLIIYIFAFFYFTYKKKKNYTYLMLGIGTYAVVFILFGIPDLLLGKGEYSEYLTSNISFFPNSLGNLLGNFQLGQPWWVYILSKTVPLNYGLPFFGLYIIALFYWIRIFVTKRFLENYKNNKNEIFLLISFLTFFASLVPLKLGMNGNKLLVLLPFLSILTSTFLYRFWKQVNRRAKKIFLLLLLFIIVIQSYLSLIHIFIKWEPDVRHQSSVWLQKNVKADEKIGIENIPIYQSLPDFILMEYYLKIYNSNTKTKFTYDIINSTSENLPKIVVIADAELEMSNVQSSPKKRLINRLRNEGYLVKAEFFPHRNLYMIFGNELDLRTSGIVPIPTITIYIRTYK